MFSSFFLSPAKVTYETLQKLTQVDTYGKPVLTLLLLKIV